MLATMTEAKPETQPAAPAAPVPAAPARPELRVFRPDSPYVALGLAVNHLMTKPAFAALKFGEWSRILVGQINRKHYYFVVDAKNQVQGFIGWAITTRDKAEEWAEGRGALTYEDSFDGDCIIFNAWAATSGKVNRFLLQEARKIMVGKAMVYGKRHYNDGTTRVTRLEVNEFVGGHLEGKNAG
jgi:hemolysin-activating ACP:hemolysin acyltransferase